LKAEFLRWIGERSAEEVEQIKALRQPGLFFEREQEVLSERPARRTCRWLSASLLGVGGSSPIDSLLNGKARPGRWTGMPSAGIAKEETLQNREEHYQNVVLTLDKQVQHEVETELSQAVQKWGAKGGFVIAMDPFTGRILAMATYPSFNPNQFLQYRSSLWRNRAISDTFEPGSLFKAFLAAVAIEESGSTIDSFYCRMAPTPFMIARSMIPQNMDG
jgi:cell division protein FtsI/penicillin-binding protein 2